MKGNGYGVYTHADGARYEGTWKDHLKEGGGKSTWPDGSVFEGNYKAGLKHG